VRRTYSAPVITATPFPIEGEMALWLRSSSGGYNWSYFVEVRILKLGIKRVTVLAQLKAGGTRQVVVARHKLYPPNWNQGTAWQANID
jgi:hypothetical protein